MEENREAAVFSIRLLRPKALESECSRNVTLPIEDWHLKWVPQISLKPEC